MLSHAIQRVQPIFINLWLLLKEIIATFIEKSCQRTAAALTYMTLFALVPLLAVFYAMFSLFPAFDGLDQQLQDMIFSHLLPDSGSDLTSYLSDFSSKARELSAPGAALLIVTAYIMLTNIEKSFNFIWGVKKARRGMSSFLIYWAVLSIGPLLLGSGLAISTYLLSLQLLVDEYDIYGLSRFFFSLFPWFMTASTFTLLFAAVPNCRVPIKFAIIGGVISALCFEMLKWGFGYVVANSSFNSIYGAFAVVPLFLLWINCLWMIILAGAVLVRSLSERGYKKGSSKYSNFTAVLRLLSMFADKKVSGQFMDDAACMRCVINLTQWNHLRNLLVDHNWIAITNQNDYVLVRDLSALTLLDVANLVHMPVNEMTQAQDADQKWQDVLQLTQKDMAQHITKTYNMSLSALYSGKSTVPTQKTEDKP